jgi:hypothetical protein
MRPENRKSRKRFTRKMDGGPAGGTVHLLIIFLVHVGAAVAGHFVLELTWLLAIVASLAVVPFLYFIVAWLWHRAIGKPAHISGIWNGENRPAKSVDGEAAVNELELVVHSFFGFVFGRLVCLTNGRLYRVFGVSQRDRVSLVYWLGGNHVGWEQGSLVLGLSNDELELKGAVESLFQEVHCLHRGPCAFLRYCPDSPLAIRPR